MSPAHKMPTPIEKKSWAFSRSALAAPTWTGKMPVVGIYVNARLGIFPAVPA